MRDLVPGDVSSAVRLLELCRAVVDSRPVDIATLVEEGYCKIQPGLRGAHLVTSIKPYRQNTDKPIDDPAINPFKS